MKYLCVPTHGYFVGYLFSINLADTFHVFSSFSKFLDKQSHSGAPKKLVLQTLLVQIFVLKWAKQNSCRSSLFQDTYLARFSSRSWSRLHPLLLVSVVPRCFTESTHGSAFPLSSRFLSVRFSRRKATHFVLLLAGFSGSCEQRTMAANSERKQC